LLRLQQCRTTVNSFEEAPFDKLIAFQPTDCRWPHKHESPRLAASASWFRSGPKQDVALPSNSGGRYATGDRVHGVALSTRATIGRVECFSRLDGVARDQGGTASLMTDSIPAVHVVGCSTALSHSRPKKRDASYALCARHYAEWRIMPRRPYAPTAGVVCTGFYAA
jgi:hypothetical protein